MNKIPTPIQRLEVAEPYSWLSWISICRQEGRNDSFQWLFCDTDRDGREEMSNSLEESYEEWCFVAPSPFEQGLFKWANENETTSATELAEVTYY